MTEDLNKIQDGIGEKMGMLVRFIVTFLGSLIYPYTQNWLVSLVISSVLPLMILFGGMKLSLKNKYIDCLIMVIPRLYKTILSEKCYKETTGTHLERGVQGDGTVLDCGCYGGGVHAGQERRILRVGMML